MRNKKKTMAVILIVMLLGFVLFSSHGQGLFTQSNSYELVYDRLVMKESPQDVPVVIVDQHQEVIPYWYKAVKEGLIKAERNTVIHFDAHSDMAMPTFPKAIRKFQFYKSRSEKQFLPLMDTNDRFLQSAILEGLIGRIIWVKPDWSTNNNTQVKKGHVGVTPLKGREVFCACERFVYKKKAYPLECGYENPENPLNFTRILPERCAKKKTFMYIETTEKDFISAIKIKDGVSLFVDIDEDFFGVESGVQHFIDEGISLKTQKVLDVLMSRLYAADSHEDELTLDKLMRVLFEQMLEEKSEEKTQEQRQEEIEKKVTLHTERYFISESKNHVREFSIYLSTLTVSELRRLSRAKYCRQQSPRLADSDRNEFTLCHGYIYPGDKLNAIHVDSKKVLNQRAKNVEEILYFITKSTVPKLVTVARSLRDGYTPRDQQQYIERLILGSIDRAIATSGKRKKVIFDSQLSFGKEGWVEDGILKY